jgi:hypothetical protein
MKSSYKTLEKYVPQPYNNLSFEDSQLIRARDRNIADELYKHDLVKGAPSNYVLPPETTLYRKPDPRGIVCKDDTVCVPYELRAERIYNRGKQVPLNPTTEVMNEMERIRPKSLMPKVNVYDFLSNSAIDKENYMTLEAQAKKTVPTPSKPTVTTTTGTTTTGTTTNTKTVTSVPGTVAGKTFPPGVRPVLTTGCGGSEKCTENQVCALTTGPDKICNSQGKWVVLSDNVAISERVGTACSSKNQMSVQRIGGSGGTRVFLKCGDNYKWQVVSDSPDGCSGWDCTQEGQRCRPGQKGSNGMHWYCISDANNNKKWTPPITPSSNCSDWLYRCNIKDQLCLKGTTGAGSSNWKCDGTYWRKLSF